MTTDEHGAALALDHVVLAGADLARASEEFADQTGVVPAPGGPHTGLGTQNALASLGEGLYVELIVPDPATASDDNLGGHFATLAGLGLFTWALRSEDLIGLRRDLAQRRLTPSPIMETTRDHPDGTSLVWDLMGLPGLGGAWPFFIDWRDCDHPSSTNPVAGELVTFEASLPAEDRARLAFAEARNVLFTDGPAGLDFAIDTKSGEVRWAAAAPRGFYG